MGGLPETLDAAAKAAGIEEYNTVDYPKFEENFSSLIADLQLTVGIKQLFNAILPQSLQTKIEQVQQSQPVDYFQTVLPFELKIY